VGGASRPHFWTFGALSATLPQTFLQAFGAKETTLKRLRKVESNKSDLGGVLQTNNIHIAVAAPGEVPPTLTALKSSTATAPGKGEVRPGHRRRMAVSRRGGRSRGGGRRLSRGRNALQRAGGAPQQVRGTRPGGAAFRDPIARRGAGLADRTTLWNAVEALEKRCDARSTRRPARGGTGMGRPFRRQSPCLRCNGPSKRSRSRRRTWITTGRTAGRAISRLSASDAICSMISRSTCGSGGSPMGSARRSGTCLADGIFEDGPIPKFLALFMGSANPADKQNVSESASQQFMEDWSAGLSAMRPQFRTRAFLSEQRSASPPSVSLRHPRSAGVRQAASPRGPLPARPPAARPARPRRPVAGRDPPARHPELTA